MEYANEYDFIIAEIKGILSNPAAPGFPVVEVFPHDKAEAYIFFELGGEKPTPGAESGADQAVTCECVVLVSVVAPTPEALRGVENMARARTKWLFREAIYGSLQRQRHTVIGSGQFAMNVDIQDIVYLGSEPSLPIASNTHSHSVLRYEIQYGTTRVTS